MRTRVLLVGLGLCGRREAKPSRVRRSLVPAVEAFWTDRKGTSGPYLDACEVSALRPSSYARSGGEGAEKDHGGPCHLGERRSLAAPRRSVSLRCVLIHRGAARVVLGAP